MAASPCSRCGRPCRVTGPGDPEARIFRRAAGPKGYCANCVVTEFLMNTYPVNMDLDEKGPECLRNPDLQRLFGDLMRTVRADADPDEIDWDRVIADWDLPVVIVLGNPRNPYMPVHPRRARPDECYEDHCQARNHKATRGGPTAKRRRRRARPDDQATLF